MREIKIEMRPELKNVIRKAGPPKVNPEDLEYLRVKKSNANDPD